MEDIVRKMGGVSPIPCKGSLTSGIFWLFLLAAISQSMVGTVAGGTQPEGQVTQNAARQPAARKKKAGDKGTQLSRSIIPHRSRRGVTVRPQTLTSADRNRKIMLPTVPPPVPLLFMGGDDANQRLLRPMTFSLHHTDPFYRTGRTFILAEGMITEDTPDRFLTFIKKLEISSVPIYFNSLGGKIGPALRLGLIIRQLKLETFVGGPYRSCAFTDETGREVNMASMSEGSDDELSDLLSKEESCDNCTYSCHQPLLLVKNGFCLSACAYAFLGGVKRKVGQNGVYGVHQIKLGEAVSDKESTAQVVMALLANYLDMMGVNRRLLDYASITSAEKITPITPKIAKELNVDNSDPPLSPWTIGVTKDGMIYAQVFQPLPAANNNFLFHLFFSHGELRGLVLYQANIPGRTSEDVEDALFNEIGDPYILVGELEYPLKKIEGWTRCGPYFCMLVSIPPNTLKAMINVKEFVFTCESPMAYMDITPHVRLSSQNLKQSVNAMLKVLK